MWFHKPDTHWPANTCIREYLALTSEWSQLYQCEDVISTKQILPKISLNQHIFLHGPLTILVANFDDVHTWLSL